MFVALLCCCFFIVLGVTVWEKGAYKLNVLLLLVEEVVVVYYIFKMNGPI